MRAFALLSLLLLFSGFGIVATSSPAEAQATCRNACMSEENACLQRTGNKGQCGRRSSDCMGKCR